MSHEKLLLNEREAAARLGVPVEWLKKLAEEGRVPFIPVGRRRFYVLDVLMSSLSAQARREGGEA
jgi:excisionase family DNA binding protein